MEEQEKDVMTLESTMDKLCDEINKFVNRLKINHVVCFGPLHDDGQDNCWNSTINLTSHGSIGPLNREDINVDNYQYYLGTPGGFDKTLGENYRNINSPEMGCAIRYSNDGTGKSTSHGAVFLLITDDGKTQIFTKNGIGNDSPYQLDYQENITGYGPVTGRKDYKVDNNYDKNAPQVSQSDKTGWYLNTRN